MGHAGEIDPAALEELPIFPLGQVVLFPRALLPLHIFEPRYRTMLRDVLEAPPSRRAMAVALIADPSEKDPVAQPRIESVAGVGLVVEHHALPDGRSNILLHGQARVRLEELPFVPPYRRARATVLHETTYGTTDEDRTLLLTMANGFAAEVQKRDKKFSFRLPPSLEIGRVADLCAHHLIIDARTRQAVLEELDVAERVRKVLAALADQSGSLARDGGGAPN